MAFTFKTKPREEQLSFLTECHRCRAELSISNGRIDRHECGPITGTLDEVLAALDNR